MEDETKEKAKSEELATAIRIWAFLALVIGIFAFVIWMGWEEDTSSSGFWRGLTRLLWVILSHLK